MGVVEVIKTGAQIASWLASAAAVAAAAYWFVVTGRKSPRVQFDLDCGFFHLNEKSIVAELRFIFENKGFIEHRLFDLTVSVHGLKSNDNLNTDNKSKKILFERRLLPTRLPVISRRIGFYFVRPGVRQVFTHIVTIPSDVPIVRVTASFSYKRPKLLFSLDSGLRGDFDTKGKVSAELRKQFGDHGIRLSEESEIETCDVGSRWLISDTVLVRRIRKRTRIKEYMAIDDKGKQRIRILRTDPYQHTARRIFEVLPKKSGEA